MVDGLHVHRANRNAAGTGVTNANGGITVPASSNGSQLLYGRTLNNAGTATLSNTFYSPSFGYYFYLGYGSVINNQADGIWNYTTDSPWLNTTTGGGTFNNAGTFEKTGGSNTTSVNPTFNNSGSVLANSATLTFATYAQTAGTTSLGGGTLSFGSTPAIQGGSVTGSGTISGAYTGSISTNPGGTLAPGASTPTCSRRAHAKRYRRRQLFLGNGLAEYQGRRRERRTIRHDR